MGRDVALCHGSPRRDIEYLLETPVGVEARLATPYEIRERLGGRILPHITLLACGHSHVPRMVRLCSGLLIVNASSVGLPAYGYPYPLSTYHCIESGSRAARYAIAEQRDGRWFCELVSVPYDHESAAQQADLRQRPDWSHALRTEIEPLRGFYSVKGA